MASATPSTASKNAGFSPRGNTPNPTVFETSSTVALFLSGHGSVAFHAYPCRNPVGQHVLQNALPLGDFADLHAGFRRHPLVGAGLEELAHPHSAGVARRAARGQNVICAYGLVAVGNRGFLADEQRSVVASAARNRNRCPARAAQDVPARNRRSGGLASSAVVGDIHDPIDRATTGWRLRGSAKPRVAFPPLHRLPRKVLAHADEAEAAVRIVFGLPKQIAGDQRRIGVIVGHAPESPSAPPADRFRSARRVAAWLRPRTVARAAQHVHRLTIRPSRRPSAPAPEPRPEYRSRPPRPSSSH